MGRLGVVQVQKEAPSEEQEEEAETKVRQKQGVLSIEREPGFLLGCSCSVKMRSQVPVSLASALGRDVKLCHVNSAFFQGCSF